MCNELLGLVICRLIARQFQRLIEPFFSGESEHYLQRGYSLDSSKDIVAAATAWQHPQQCTFIHTFIHTFHPMGGVFVIVLYITSLSTNEIGRYLNYIQNRKSARSAAWGMGARDAIVDSRRLSGSLYVFLSDVIYTHALLHDCEASRKACGLFELLSLLTDPVRSPDRVKSPNRDISPDRDTLHQEIFQSGWFSSSIIYTSLLKSSHHVTWVPHSGYFSQTMFFPVRDKYLVQGIVFNLNGKVNFYCWPSEKHSSKIKIGNGS